MSEWPVHCDPTAPFGQRLVQVAGTALAGGTLGQTRRSAIYSAFVACGQAQDLSGVKTSCGVFVRACMHWAGRLVPGKATPGQPLVGAPGASWLGLHEAGAAWRIASVAASHATPGCIFIKQAPDHVGILLAELVPGVWATAEGGGGDGTDCKITWRALDDSFPHLVGLWLPEFLDAGDPPLAPGVALPAFPIVKGDTRRDVVTRWQRRLLAARPDCLPHYGADGGYGTETVTATLALLKRAGLPGDGTSVTLDMWEACQ